MDFYDILEEKEEGQTVNPYASKKDGEYVEGTTSIDYLNSNFGHLDNVEEMINSTEIESYKKYFVWLKQKGILT